MTANPVDLTNLREMIEGDAELEESLFQEFYSSCEKAIATLQVSLLPEKTNQWRTAAHALKGVAYSLGAHVMGDTCKHAQDECESSSERKSELLASIEHAFAAVKHYRENNLPR